MSVRRSDHVARPRAVRALRVIRSCSQPSTSVQAAQWTTAAGCSWRILFEDPIAGDARSGRHRTTSWPRSLERGDDLTADLTIRTRDDGAHLVRPGRTFVHRRARPERLPPRVIRCVPTHGRGEPGVEVEGRRPPELIADLRPVERVAPVVAGPVGNDRLERRGSSSAVQHRFAICSTRPLDAGADAICLAETAHGLQHELIARQGPARGSTPRRCSLDVYNGSGWSSSAQARTAASPSPGTGTARYRSRQLVIVIGQPESRVRPAPRDRRPPSTRCRASGAGSGDDSVNSSSLSSARSP